MEIEVHNVDDTKVAEVISADIILRSADDVLDLLGNLYYLEVSKVVLHHHQIKPDFFELKNGLAGDILQKFSNYRIKLAIIGDFSQYTSKSIKDFIFESNKGRHINFVPSLAEALKRST